MTAEQKFYQWFRKQLPIIADCCRVETTTMGGMPDVNVCLRGVEIWVELKVFVGGRVLIRPEQNAWLHRRAAAGGRVFVVAQHQSGIIHVWKPGLDTTPHGKYLWIVGKSATFHYGLDLINFLFTT